MQSKVNIQDVDYYNKKSPESNMQDSVRLMSEMDDVGAIRVN